MNQEERNYLKDKLYILVKERFFRYLNGRNDISIPTRDAEESFLALWIFIHKKNPCIIEQPEEPVNFLKAENFYRKHIEESQESKGYIKKLLISYKKE